MSKAIRITPENLDLISKECDIPKSDMKVLAEYSDRYIVAGLEGQYPWMIMHESIFEERYSFTTTEPKDQFAEVFYK